MPGEQHPKRSLSELKPRELRHIVREIQKTLWQVEFADDKQRSTGRGTHKYWDANKQWDCPALLSEIATELEGYGLRPIDPPVVQGFDSIDDFIEALPKDPPPDEQPFPEIDRSDSEDPDYGQGQPGGNEPTS
jgi:hypothetical protein